jgi:signal transduction histidine kinase
MVARSRNIVSNLHSMAGPQLSLLDLLTYVEAEFRLADTPEYQLSSEGAPRDLHPFLRDEVYSICREAIANAFRHAVASRIEARIVFLPRKLVVTIVDDGIGMSKSIRTSGRTGHFGLSGMQAHARRINAMLQVESVLGSGTRITLEAPLSATISGHPGRLFFWRRLSRQKVQEQAETESLGASRGPHDSV